MNIEILDYAYKQSNTNEDFYWIAYDADGIYGEIDIPAKELGNYIAATENGYFDPEKLLVTIPEDGAGYWCYVREQFIETPTQALTYTVQDWMTTHADDEFRISYLRTEDTAAAILLAA